MLYEDKRNFFRMMVNAEVQLTLIDSEAGRQIDGVCRDLSATGMAIEIDEPIEMNITLKVKIASSNNSVPSLEALVSSV
jgi:c-di-GMP-binding flagellar brake protein YcgR